MSEQSPAQKNKTIGLILLGASVAAGVFVYSHRPPTGMGDLFARGDSFFLREEVYYPLLAVSVLVGLAGLYRLSKK